MTLKIYFGDSKWEKKYHMIKQNYYFYYFFYMELFYLAF